MTYVHQLLEIEIAAVQLYIFDLAATGAKREICWHKIALSLADEYRREAKKKLGFNNDTRF